MIVGLKERFGELVTLAKNDPFFGMPEFIKAQGYNFLRQNHFIIFSDPHDGMAGEVCHVLGDHSVLGVCANVLPPGCEGRELLTATDLYKLASKFDNLIGVMATDDPSFDLGLQQIALAAKIRTIPHHLILRLANATTDLRNADWLPVIKERADEYFALIDSLDDEFSKATTVSVLLSQMTGDHGYRRGVERPYHTLYFNTGLFRLSDKEVFVDCGASVGESISNLLRETNMKLEHSFEIEPDRFNVLKLEKLRMRLARFGLLNRIEVVPCAVGDCEDVVPFNHVGGHSGSVSASATDTVRMTTIDKVTEQFATFIKMDLEGYERFALAGARETIARCRPKLAISAYHRPDDLIEITKFVRSIRPDYKVGVQHHTFHRWDTCLYFY